MKKFGIKKFTVLFSVIIVLSLTSAALASWQEDAFNYFKELVKNNYIFRDHKNIDWGDLYSRHEGQILNSIAPVEFAERLGEMVNEIRDFHFWVYNTQGEFRRTTSPDFSNKIKNYNLNAISGIIPTLQTVNDRISTAIVQRGNLKVAYLMINSWGAANEYQYYVMLPELLQTELRNTNALIIDVRMNEGGSTANFMKEEPAADGTVGAVDNVGFISYFAEYDEVKPVGYFAILDPATGNIEHVKVRTRGLKMGEGIPYQKPVVILMGNRSISATESFIMHLMHFPNITTMGTTSFGSTGIVDQYSLNGYANVFIPRRELTDFNFEYNEDKGITPDINVPFIDDGSDNVLISAFTYLEKKITDGDNGNNNDSRGGGCNTNTMAGTLILVMSLFVLRKIA